MQERRELRLKLQEWDSEILKILVDENVKLVDDAATATRLNGLKNLYDEAVGRCAVYAMRVFSQMNDIMLVLVVTNGGGRCST